ncbi:CaiB/BaiF CoA transferase family protein [Peptostreptococcus canis]|uniref:CoA transferase n=1 Tax=Peptostreptococcus canis TaxID=1159213 RepID=A0ABR6TIP3_9FIRM|nr:CaiB/BaiF CoA-transferase family protein [Peptostreptococcus canis]MBC2575286.1 CoA transferase [Peptostreptococcus canis]MBP1997531.1 crotonobetainyl-CoA:carnitine CoA-transferase CaiB-like acyl-CoA transferase [Peptostreptococcus canis]
MKGNTALSNLKILDFTTLLPGPYATLMLADMGAEVLKVSSKSKLDLVYEMGAFDEELQLSANQLWLNRNKKTISLNLKSQKGIEIIKELIKEYDIVFEQFRPGVMEKLGLSYEELSKVNPKLIYCSISSYGNSGPLMNLAGHDNNFLAKSGLLSLAGRKSTGPSLMSTQIGDIAGGALHSIIGVLAAVNYRNITGKGQYVDISMLDTIIPMNTFEGISYLMSGELKERESFELNGKGIYDIYQTSDNEYITIGSLEPKFLKKLSDAVKLPELAEKGSTPNDGGILKTKLIEIIKSKPLSHWNEIFGNLDACIEPVLNFKQSFDQDPQIKAREMIVDVDAGKKTVRQFAMPIKFSESDVIYEFAGREIGYDTYDIMKKLGYNEEEISEFESQDVFK